jgi:hypothetical protein
MKVMDIGHDHVHTHVQIDHAGLSDALNTKEISDRMSELVICKDAMRCILDIAMRTGGVR